MPTHDYDIANQSGAAFRTDLNNALKAIQTNNSNSSSPASTEAFQFWADTTSGTLKIRNSSNNAWIELFQLDGTLTLEDGAVGTPALAFRDDLDTGIYSSAANKFNVATAGVERMELGATTIFNEDGADVDFRIEGDTEANLFYVDAGNDRIGLATASPEDLLHLKGGKIRIENTVVSNNDSHISYDNSEFLISVDPNNVRGSSVFKVAVDNVVRMSVAADGGDLTISDGNLVIGTAGHGIDFAATSNGTGSSQNELFDDYEEGNWTPANSDLTVTVFYARYTRVGRVVHIVADVQYASSPSDTSQVGYLTGLPFANSGISTHINLPWFGTQSANDNQFFNTFFTPLIFANDDKVAFLDSRFGAFFPRSTLAGKKIRINSMYFV